MSFSYLLWLWSQKLETLRRSSFWNTVDIRGCLLSSGAARCMNTVRGLFNIKCKCSGYLFLSDLVSCIFFWILNNGDTPTGPLNSHFQNHICTSQSSAANVCCQWSSCLQQAAISCRCLLTALLQPAAPHGLRRSDEETRWTTAGAATCRIHSAAGQLLGEVNAAGGCCFSCVDFLNCAQLWLGCCCRCRLLFFVPQACVAVTLSCSVCSAAVFNAECSSSCVWY